MIEIYGTIFARAAEIERGMLIRRLAGFHVIVDVGSTENDAVRLSGLRTAARLRLGRAVSSKWHSEPYTTR